MSVREQTFQGGAFLAVRQVLGVVLRLGGVLVLTRLIGPADYGIYAGSNAIVTVLVGVAALGTDGYLIRRRDEPDKTMEDQAFTLLCVTTIVVGVSAFFAAPLLSTFLDERFILPLQVLILVLPVNVLWIPARTRLERWFRYRALAVVELGGDVALYGTALPLAATGAGVWAPVAGYAASQAWLLVASYTASRYRPWLRWRPDVLRDMVGFGLGYSSADWVFRLRQLINPVIVGGFLGPAAVGYVALATRVVESLGFAKRATERLSYVALAQMQDDPRRLRRSHAEGMALQVLGVGAPLAGFAFVASWVIPTFFGDRWEPAARVYTFVALALLLATMFYLHQSTLQVHRRTLAVTQTNVMQVALFGATAAALVPFVGVIGYGIADSLKSFGFGWSHVKLRALFPPDYRLVLPWMVAWAPPLFAPLLPVAWSPVLLLPLALVLFRKQQRDQLATYLSLARGALTQRGGKP